MRRALLLAALAMASAACFSAAPPQADAPDTDPAPAIERPALSARRATARRAAVDPPARPTRTAVVSGEGSTRIAPLADAAVPARPRRTAVHAPSDGPDEVRTPDEEEPAETTSDAGRGTDRSRPAPSRDGPGRR